MDFIIRKTRTDRVLRNLIGSKPVCKSQYSPGNSIQAREVSWANKNTIVSTAIKVDFRPFYCDLSTNKVISGNSYYEIINNLPIKQFNNFCNIQGKKYFILSHNKQFINRVSSICTRWGQNLKFLSLLWVNFCDLYSLFSNVMCSSVSLLHWPHMCTVKTKLARGSWNQLQNNRINYEFS